MLDACLAQLEDANARDEHLVSTALAKRVGEYVPAVMPGLTLSKAIGMVLREQESLMRAGDHEQDDSGLGTPRLDTEAALSLTARIREATKHVCLLLLEAHKGRAWVPLGHTSWEQYVHDEFGISRSRSYELLDQGRVIEAVVSAAGLSEIPDISAYAAGQLKGRLKELVAAIRRRIGKEGSSRAAQIVVDVVRQERALAAVRAPEAEPTLALAPRWSIARLHDAISMIAALPAPELAAKQLSARRSPDLDDIHAAATWLTGLHSALAAHPTDGEREAFRVY
jgi:hypothetical protein